MEFLAIINSVAHGHRRTFPVHIAISRLCSSVARAPRHPTTRYHGRQRLRKHQLALSILVPGELSFWPFTPHFISRSDPSDFNLSRVSSRFPSPFVQGELKAVCQSILIYATLPY